VRVFSPRPYFAVYSASKAFVLHFRLALWSEYRCRGIRVLAVCPSWVIAGPSAGRKPRSDEDEQKPTSMPVPSRSPRMATPSATDTQPAPRLQRSG
jgi:short-subunit dehydrogenase